MEQPASSQETIGCHHQTLPSLATYHDGVIPASVVPTAVGFALLMGATKVRMGYEDELAGSGLEWLTVDCIVMNTFHTLSAVVKYKI